MKSSIAALAFAITGAFAAPVGDTASDNAFEGSPLSMIQKFDATSANGPGEGWIFSPPGFPTGAMVKFYQNNSVLSGSKGRAYILEIHENVDTKQLKAVANARNVNTEQPLAAPSRPFAVPQRQAAPPPGFGTGAGAGTTIRPNAGGVSPAAPAAPGALVPAAPAAQACSALLAPSAFAGPTQGGPTITGLITQAGQLIGQQIGVSLGNLIGSTLEGVVTTYFPAPKSGAPPPAKRSEVMEY